jgi:hypothetical protein
MRLFLARVACRYIRSTGNGMNLICSPATDER